MNFITSFPTIALQSIENLKVLNLSANMIYHLDSSNFEHLKNLQILDLSRNGIFSVPPSTFRDLNTLRYLDLSLNSLRTVSAANNSYFGRVKLNFCPFCP